ncbi:hypothetical protein LCGC14_1279190 [marine sediment metagenome]|uniref:Uncharacterized protein n=1 Tax=marine sediment metagenome TaxID=412755 RepID=A0A0F9NYU0_9ZZZZ
MRKLLQVILLLLVFAPSLAWGQVVIPGTGGATPAVAAGNRTSVIPALCTGTDKVTGIATGGIVVCNTDVTGTTSPLTTKGDLWGFSTVDGRLGVGSNDQCLVADSTAAFGIKWGSCAVGGSGITSLGAQTGSTQTFSDVDDTNVTLTIASAADNHAFTLGWTGTLADSRLAQITTASKVSGAAITLLTSVPSGAGNLPVANLPDVEALTTSLTAARCVRINAGGTALEVAAADCNTAGADGVGYDEVLEEAAGLTKRAQTNFIGVDVTAVDNGGATRTDVTIIPVAEAYDATGWNADTGAASKDNIRDKIEALDFSDLAGTVGDAQIAAGAVDGGSGGEIADGSIVSADLATANKTFKCNFTLFDPGGLADTDDIPSISNCTRPGRAITITEIWAETDAGTPSINLQRDDGTPANICTANLTPTTGGATCTVAAAEDNFAATDRLDFLMISASTAKRINIAVEYTVD